MPDNAILVFLKYPEPGRVKTRLAQDLDQDLVLALYKAFVRDTLDTASKIITPTLFFTPADKQSQIKNWLGSSHNYIAQKGNDLGQRMANAFHRIFDSGAGQALLIGTDIPQLSEDVLQEAFVRLKNNDIVLGPAVDGGYYLIGCTKENFMPAVFNGIDWSTDRVLEQTLAAVKRCHLSAGLLETLDDVDTALDLEALANRVKSGLFVGRRTQKLLCDMSGLR